MTEITLAAGQAAGPNDEQRRRRIEICEGADRMIAGVAAIGFDNSLRDEIINLIIVAQRLALKLSDGHVAPFKMQSW